MQIKIYNIPVITIFIVKRLYYLAFQFVKEHALKALNISLSTHVR